eukprot:Sspe_Gene.48892::Locus_25857_Transcript_1_1_Confidence_1.000_Length_21943::g.48892::m.48892
MREFTKIHSMSRQTALACLVVVLLLLIPAPAIGEDVVCPRPVPKPPGVLLPGGRCAGPEYGQRLGPLLCGPQGASPTDALCALSDNRTGSLLLQPPVFNASAFDTGCIEYLCSASPSCGGVTYEGDAVYLLSLGAAPPCESASSQQSCATYGLACAWTGVSCMPSVAGADCPHCSCWVRVNETDGAGKCDPSTGTVLAGGHCICDPSTSVCGGAGSCEPSRSTPRFATLDSHRRFHPQILATRMTSDGSRSRPYCSLTTSAQDCYDQMCFTEYKGVSTTHSLTQVNTTNGSWVVERITGQDPRLFFAEPGSWYMVDVECTDLVGPPDQCNALDSAFTHCLVENCHASYNSSASRSQCLCRNCETQLFANCSVTCQSCRWEPSPYNCSQGCVASTHSVQAPSGPGTRGVCSSPFSSAIIVHRESQPPHVLRVSKLDGTGQNASETWPGPNSVTTIACAFTGNGSLLGVFTNSSGVWMVSATVERRIASFGVRVAIAVLESGEVVVAFDDTSFPYGIHGRVVNTNGRHHTSIFPIDPDGALPVVSSSSTELGGFVVVWQTTNTSTFTYGVSARRFRKEGTPVGPPERLQPPTCTSNPGHQIGKLPHGGWVIGYECDGEIHTVRVSSSWTRFSTSVEQFGSMQQFVGMATTVKGRYATLVRSLSGYITAMWHTPEHGGRDGVVEMGSGDSDATMLGVASAGEAVHLYVDSSQSEVQVYSSTCGGASPSCPARCLENTCDVLYKRLRTGYDPFFHPALHCADCPDTAKCYPSAVETTGCMEQCYTNTCEEIWGWQSGETPCLDCIPSLLCSTCPASALCDSEKAKNFSPPTDRCSAWLCTSECNAPPPFPGGFDCPEEICDPAVACKGCVEGNMTVLNATRFIGEEPASSGSSVAPIRCFPGAKEWHGEAQAECPNSHPVAFNYGKSCCTMYAERNATTCTGVTIACPKVPCATRRCSDLPQCPESPSCADNTTRDTCRETCGTCAMCSTSPCASCQVKEDYFECQCGPLKVMNAGCGGGVGATRNCTPVSCGNMQTCQNPGPGEEDFKCVCQAPAKGPSQAGAPAACTVRCPYEYPYATSTECCEVLGRTGCAGSSIQCPATRCLDYECVDDPSCRLQQGPMDCQLSWAQSMCRVTCGLCPSPGDCKVNPCENQTCDDPDGFKDDDFYCVCPWPQVGEPARQNNASCATMCPVTHPYSNSTTCCQAPLATDPNCSSSFQCESCVSYNCTDNPECPVRNVSDSNFCNTSFAEANCPVLCGRCPDDCATVPCKSGNTTCLDSDGTLNAAYRCVVEGQGPCPLSHPYPSTSGYSCCTEPSCRFESTPCPFTNCTIARCSDAGDCSVGLADFGGQKEQFCAAPESQGCPVMCGVCHDCGRHAPCPKSQICIDDDGTLNEAYVCLCMWPSVGEANAGAPAVCTEMCPRSHPITLDGRQCCNTSGCEGCVGATCVNYTCSDHAECQTTAKGLSTGQDLCQMDLNQTVRNANGTHARELCPVACQSCGDCTPLTCSSGRICSDNGTLDGSYRCRCTWPSIETPEGECKGVCPTTHPYLSPRGQGCCPYKCPEPAPCPVSIEGCALCAATSEECLVCEEGYYMTLNSSCTGTCAPGRGPRDGCEQDQITCGHDNCTEYQCIDHWQCAQSGSQSMCKESSMFAGTQVMKYDELCPSFCNACRSNCSQSELLGCDGKCVDQAKLGDGSCDVSLNCDQYGKDAGDCVVIYINATRCAGASCDVEGHCAACASNNTRCGMCGAACSSHACTACLEDELLDCAGECTPMSRYGDGKCDEILNCNLAVGPYDGPDCTVTTYQAGACRPCSFDCFMCSHSSDPESCRRCYTTCSADACAEKITVVDECKNHTCGAGQRCVDVDTLPSSLNDWECRCLCRGCTGTERAGNATCRYDECEVNECKGANQGCVDPDPTYPPKGDWFCRCSSPFKGNDGRPANCSLDECAAGEAGYVRCNESGQLCHDPDHSLLNDFRCSCPSPQQSATTIPHTVNGPHACVLDECTIPSIADTCSTCNGTCSHPSDNQTCHDLDKAPTAQGTWVCQCPPPLRSTGGERGKAVCTSVMSVGCRFEASPSVVLTNFFLRTLVETVSAVLQCSPKGSMECTVRIGCATFFDAGREQRFCRVHTQETHFHTLGAFAGLTEALHHYHPLSIATVNVDVRIETAAQHTDAVETNATSRIRSALNDPDGSFSKALKAGGVTPPTATVAGQVAVRLCQSNEHANGGVCRPCPPGSTRPAGDDPTIEDTLCNVDPCKVNEHVVAHSCRTCPLGTTSHAGAFPTGEDTECTVVRCSADQRVVSHTCLPCPAGETSEAGGDASGPDTSCAPVECGVDEHVVQHVCTPCPADEFRFPGDLASGNDTACTPRCAGVNCTAPSPCMESACDPKTGRCVHSALPDNQLCDDGDPATKNTTCRGGWCGGAPECGGGCPDWRQCHRLYCNGSTCLTRLVSHEPCNDTDATTAGDVCVEGTCFGKTITCQSYSGGCLPLPSPENTACPGGVCSPQLCCQSCTAYTGCSTPSPLAYNFDRLGAQCNTTSPVIHYVLVDNSSRGPYGWGSFEGQEAACASECSANPNCVAYGVTPGRCTIYSSGGDLRQHSTLFVDARVDVTSEAEQATPQHFVATGGDVTTESSCHVKPTGTNRRLCRSSGCTASQCCAEKKCSLPPSTTSPVDDCSRMSGCYWDGGCRATPGMCPLRGTWVVTYRATLQHPCQRERTDVWLIGADGEVWKYDPAVSFGHIVYNSTTRVHTIRWPFNNNFTHDILLFTGGKMEGTSAHTSGACQLVGTRVERVQNPGCPDETPLPTGGTCHPELPYSYNYGQQCCAAPLTSDVAQNHRGTTTTITQVAVLPGKAACNMSKDVCANLSRVDCLDSAYGEENTCGQCLPNYYGKAGAANESCTKCEALLVQGSVEQPLDGVYRLNTSVVWSNHSVYMHSNGRSAVYFCYGMWVLAKDFAAVRGRMTGWSPGDVCYGVDYTVFEELSRGTVACHNGSDVRIPVRLLEPCPASKECENPPCSDADTTYKSLWMRCDWHGKVTNGELPTCAKMVQNDSNTCCDADLSGCTNTVSPFAPSDTLYALCEEECRKAGKICPVKTPFEVCSHALANGHTNCSSFLAAPGAQCCAGTLKEGCKGLVPHGFSGTDLLYALCKEECKAQGQYCPTPEPTLTAATEVTQVGSELAPENASSTYFHAVYPGSELGKMGIGERITEVGLYADGPFVLSTFTVVAWDSRSPSSQDAPVEYTLYSGKTSFAAGWNMLPLLGLGVSWSSTSYVHLVLCFQGRSDTSEKRFQFSEAQFASTVSHNDSCTCTECSGGVTSSVRPRVKFNTTSPAFASCDLNGAASRLAYTCPQYVEAHPQDCCTRNLSECLGTSPLPAAGDALLYTLCPAACEAKGQSCPTSCPRDQPFRRPDGLGCCDGPACNGKEVECLAPPCQSHQCRDDPLCQAWPHPSSFNDPTFCSHSANAVNSTFPGTVADICPVLCGACPNDCSGNRACGDMPCLDLDGTINGNFSCACPLSHPYVSDRRDHLNRELCCADRACYTTVPCTAGRCNANSKATDCDRMNVCGEGQECSDPDRTLNANYTCNCTRGVGVGISQWADCKASCPATHPFSYAEGTACCNAPLVNDGVCNSNSTCLTLNRKPCESTGNGSCGECLSGTTRHNGLCVKCIGLVLNESGTWPAGYFIRETLLVSGVPAYSVVREDSTVTVAWCDSIGTYVIAKLSTYQPLLFQRDCATQYMVRAVHPADFLDRNEWRTREKDEIRIVPFRCLSSDFNSRYEQPCLQEINTDTMTFTSPPNPTLLLKQSLRPPLGVSILLENTGLCKTIRFSAGDPVAIPSSSTSQYFAYFQDAGYATVVVNHTAVHHYSGDLPTAFFVGLDGCQNQSTVQRLDLLFGGCVKGSCAGAKCADLNRELCDDSTQTPCGPCLLGYESSTVDGPCAPVNPNAQLGSCRNESVPCAGAVCEIDAENAKDCKGDTCGKYQRCVDAVPFDGRFNCTCFLPLEGEVENGQAVCSTRCPPNHPVPLANTSCCTDPTYTNCTPTPCPSSGCLPFSCRDHAACPSLITTPSTQCDKGLEELSQHALSGYKGGDLCPVLCGVCQDDCTQGKCPVDQECADPDGKVDGQFTCQCKAPYEGNGTNAPAVCTFGMCEIAGTYAVEWTAFECKGTLRTVLEIEKTGRIHAFHPDVTRGVSPPATSSDLHKEANATEDCRLAAGRCWRASWGTTASDILVSSAGILNVTHVVNGKQCGEVSYTKLTGIADRADCSALTPTECPKAFPYSSSGGEECCTVPYLGDACQGGAVACPSAACNSSSSPAVAPEFELLGNGTCSDGGALLNKWEQKMKYPIGASNHTAVLGEPRCRGACIEMGESCTGFHFIASRSMCALFTNTSTRSPLRGVWDFTYGTGGGEYPSSVSPGEAVCYRKTDTTPPPFAFVDYGAGCCSTSGMTTKGNMFVSEEGCKNACRQDAQCVAVTFVLTSFSCQLHTVDGAVSEFTVNTSCSSATCWRKEATMAMEEAPGCCTVDGTHITTNTPELGTCPLSTPSLCELMCLSQVGCSAAAVGPDSCLPARENCWLYNGSTVGRTFSGSDPCPQGGKCFTKAPVRFRYFPGRPSCGVGFRAIATFSECEEAVKLVGLKVSNKQSGIRGGDVPEGCWYDPATAALFFSLSGNSSLIAGDPSNCPAVGGRCYVICTPEPPAPATSTWVGSYSPTFQLGPFGREDRADVGPGDCYVLCDGYGYYAMRYQNGTRYCYCSRSLPTTPAPEHLWATCREQDTQGNVDCVYSRFTKACSTAVYESQRCAGGVNVSVVSLGQCEAACVRDTECRYFNWASALKECELVLSSCTRIADLSFTVFQRRICTTSQTEAPVPANLGWGFGDVQEGGGTCGMLPLSPGAKFPSELLGYCNHPAKSDKTCVRARSGGAELSPFLLNGLCRCENPAINVFLGECSTETGLCIPTTPTPPVAPTPAPTPPPITDETTPVGSFVGTGRCVDANGASFSAFVANVTEEKECRLLVSTAGRANCKIVGAEYAPPSLIPAQAVFTPAQCRLLTVDKTGSPLTLPVSTAFVPGEGAGYPTGSTKVGDGECFVYTGKGPCSELDQCAACDEYEHTTWGWLSLGANKCTVSGTGRCVTGASQNCRRKACGEEVRLRMTCDSVTRSAYNLLDVPSSRWANPAKPEYVVVSITSQQHDFVFVEDRDNCSAAGYHPITSPNECKAALCAVPGISWLTELPDSTAENRVNASLVMSPPRGCSVLCEGGSSAAKCVVSELGKAWLDGVSATTCQRSSASQGIRCLCRRSRGPMVTEDSAGNCSASFETPSEPPVEYVMQTSGPGCGSAPVGGIPKAEITDVLTEEQCRHAACKIFKVHTKAGLGNWGGYPLSSGATTSHAPYTGYNPSGVSAPPSTQWAGGCSAQKGSDGKVFAVWYMPPNQCPLLSYQECTAAQHCLWDPVGSSCTAVRAGYSLCSLNTPCLCRRKAVVPMSSFTTSFVLSASELQFELMLGAEPTTNGLRELKALRDAVVSKLKAAINATDSNQVVIVRFCYRKAAAGVLTQCRSLKEINELIARVDSLSPLTRSRMHPLSADGIYVEVLLTVPEAEMPRRVDELQRSLSTTTFSSFAVVNVEAVGLTTTPAPTDDSTRLTGKCPIWVDLWGSGAPASCNPCEGSTDTNIKCGSPDSEAATREVEVVLAKGESKTLVFNTLASASLESTDSWITVKKHLQSGKVRMGVMVGDYPNMDPNMLNTRDVTRYHCRSTSGSEAGNTLCQISACGPFAVTLEAPTAPSKVLLSTCYNYPVPCKCEEKAKDGKVHGRCVLANPKRSIVEEGTGNTYEVPSVTCECDLNFGNYTSSGDLDCTVCSPGYFPWPGSTKWNTTNTVNLAKREAPACALQCGLCAGIPCGTYDDQKEECTCLGRLTGPTCEDPCEYGWYGTFCNETYNALSYTVSRSFTSDVRSYTPPPWRIAPNSFAIVSVSLTPSSGSSPGTSPGDLKQVSAAIRSLTLTARQSLNPLSGRVTTQTRSENVINAAYFGPEPTRRSSFTEDPKLHIFKGSSVYVFRVAGSSFVFEQQANVRDYYSSVNIDACADETIFGKAYDTNYDAVLFFQDPAVRVFGTARTSTGNDRLVFIKGDRICTATGPDRRFNKDRMVSNSFQSIDNMLDYPWSAFVSQATGLPASIVNKFHAGWVNTDKCNAFSGANAVHADCIDPTRESWDAVWDAGTSIVFLKDSSIRLFNVSSKCCRESDKTCLCGATLQDNIHAEHPGSFSYPPGTERPSVWKTLTVNDHFQEVKTEDYFGAHMKDVVVTAVAAPLMHSSVALPTVVFSEYTVHIREGTQWRTHGISEVFSNLNFPKTLSITSGPTSGVTTVGASVVDGPTALRFRVSVKDERGIDVLLKNDAISVDLLECGYPLTEAERRDLEILAPVVPPQSPVTSVSDVMEVVWDDRNCTEAGVGKRVVGRDAGGVAAPQSGTSEFVFSHIAINKAGRYKLRFIHRKSGASAESGAIEVVPSDCDSPEIWEGADECTRNCTDITVNTFWERLSCQLQFSSNMHWVELTAETQGYINIDFKVELVQPCCNGRGLCCAGNTACHADTTLTEYLKGGGTLDDLENSRRCTCIENNEEGYWDQRVDSNCTLCKAGYGGELCTEYTGATQLVLPKSRTKSISSGARHFYVLPTQPETPVKALLESVKGDADLAISFLPCPGQEGVTRLPAIAARQIAVPCSGQGTCQFDAEKGTTYCSCSAGFWSINCSKTCCGMHGSCSQSTGLSCKCFGDVWKGFWAPSDTFCDTTPCSGPGGSNRYPADECLFVSGSDAGDRKFVKCGTEYGGVAGQPARVWLSWRNLLAPSPGSVQQAVIELPEKWITDCSSPQTVRIYATHPMYLNRTKGTTPWSATLEDANGGKWIEQGAEPCNIVIPTSRLAGGVKCTAGASFDDKEQYCRCSKGSFCALGRCQIEAHTDRTYACNRAAPREDLPGRAGCTAPWGWHNGMLESEGRCLCRTVQEADDGLLGSVCEEGVCNTPLTTLRYNWKAEDYDRTLYDLEGNASFAGAKEQLLWSSIDPSTRFYYEATSYVQDVAPYDGYTRKIDITDWLLRFSTELTPGTMDLSFVIVTEPKPGSEGAKMCQPYFDGTASPILTIKSYGFHEPSRLFLSMEKAHLSSAQQGHPFYTLHTVDYPGALQQVGKGKDPTVNLDGTREVRRYTSLQARPSPSCPADVPSPLCGCGQAPLNSSGGTCDCPQEKMFQDPTDFVQI